MSHVDNGKARCRLWEHAQFTGCKGSRGGPGTGAWWGLGGCEDGEGGGAKAGSRALVRGLDHFLRAVGTQWTWSWWAAWSHGRSRGANRCSCLSRQRGRKVGKEHLECFSPSGTFNAWAAANVAFLARGRWTPPEIELLSVWVVIRLHGSKTWWLHFSLFTADLYPFTCREKFQSIGT